jgi:Arc/MetJ-type ribon-helix-helix transcriptional regulator
MVTIRFRLDHELVKEIDEIVVSGEYKSREEFILDSLQKYLNKLKKKK